jgi:hypothetical protein
MSLNPTCSQLLKLIMERIAASLIFWPICSHPIPSQQTVLILNEFRQRHKHNALFRPTSLSGHGKDLGG